MMLTRGPNKIKDTINALAQDQEYKAVEKMHHELQMKLKSKMLENWVNFLPLLVLMIGYFAYALIVDASLEYGQNFDYFGPAFFICLVAGLSLSVGSFLFVRPIIRKRIEEETTTLTSDVYKKGARLTNTKQFNTDMRDYMEEEARRDRRAKEYFSIPISTLHEKKDKCYESAPEDIIIPRASFSTGLAILGSPGVGKSVLLNYIIRQFPKTSKAIIFDVKGEFIEKHYNPETDIIFCPADARSIKFRFSKLCRTSVDATAIAIAAIPDDKNTSDPHWTNTARAIFEAALLYQSARDGTNKEFYDFITDYEQIEKLKFDEETRSLVSAYLNGTDNKETLSIISSLNQKSKFMRYVADLDKLDGEEMELKDWLFDGKGGKLFLSATDSLADVFAPLHAVLVSHLISAILDSKDDPNRDIFIVLDELPRLGKALNKNLEKILAVGRSKGAKTIPAFQSPSQLRKEFGEREAESILDTIKSYTAFQNQYGGEFLEKHFGKTTVIRNEESFSFAMEDMGDRVSVSRREVKESLIDDSEVKRLSKFEFYAKIEGCKDVLKSRLQLNIDLLRNPNGLQIPFIEAKGIRLVKRNPYLSSQIAITSKQPINFKSTKKIKTTKYSF